MATPLISATELAGRLDDSAWVVVDCRFVLTDPDAGRAAYRRGHIRGARYAHLDSDLARVPGPADGRHPLPRAEDFAATLGAWGISNASSVVVYDDVSGAIAARLWWMLRWVGHRAAFVLDGGLKAWNAAGLPMTGDMPHIRTVEYAVREVRRDWVVSADRVPSKLANGARLVDARSPERFQGVTEPIDPVAGHIPGAINWPFSEALQSDGRMRPADELDMRLKHLTDQPGGFIAMCGSGVTACHLLLAASAAGLEDGRIFIGSWSEWIRDPARPVATGAGAWHGG